MLKGLHITMYIGLFNFSTLNPKIVFSLLLPDTSRNWQIGHYCPNSETRI